MFPAENRHPLMAALILVTANCPRRDTWVAYGLEGGALGHAAPAAGAR
jgi:hypothetical protein